jgi:rhamnosyltransferase
MRFAGVVVLYNPEDNVFENIIGYVNELDVLFVVDNSEHKNEALIHKLRDLRQVRYLDNEGNKGIAFALNRAARGAIKLRMNWLLMMDQDSSISGDMLIKMKEYVIQNKDERLGIVAANFLKAERDRKKLSIPVTYEDEVITSGSMIDLRIYGICGGFLNSLFIDEVDHEYCLRIRKQGYKIIKLNNIMFRHNMGNAARAGAIVMYNYSPVRYYYISRNRHYVAKLYKKDFPEICNWKRQVLRRWFICILNEDKTLIKLLYIFRGYMDYQIGRMGKL